MEGIPEMLPHDTYNATLVSNAHPREEKLAPDSLYFNWEKIHD
jgi:hypothetical protein